MPVFKNLTPESVNVIMIVLAAIVIVGWGIGLVSKRIRTPQVALFIVLGAFLGSSFLGVLDARLLDRLAPINYIALAFIGFDIGGELTIRNLKRYGKSVTWISVLQSAGAFGLVLGGVLLATGNLPVALVLGAIACATAPAATVDVLREYQSSGPLTSTLFAVVGVAEALAIVIYAFASLGARTMLTEGRGISVFQAIGLPILEVIYAIGIGFVVGMVVIWLIRGVSQRESLLLVSLGSILICTGLANILECSYILANMVLGMTLVNMPRYGRRDVFEVLEEIMPPIMIIFFVLVGAHIQVSELRVLGLVGTAYIICRFLGKSTGAWTGAKIAGASPNVARYMGLCLIPEAGVSIALSIQAWTDFRTLGSSGFELATLVINLIAATVLIHELTGPILTRYAIIKAGEAEPLLKRRKSARSEEGVMHGEDV